MFRTNPTLRCIAVLIALLAACLLGAAILRANLSRPIITRGKMPSIRIEWSIPAAKLRSVRFSSLGDYLCTVSKDGEVTCYGSSGSKSFATQIAGATDAVTAPDGSFTLVYAKRDRANTELLFLDSAGEVKWRMDVGGSVWSADAGCCDAGACFAVGTGDRRIYIVTIGDSTRRYRRFRTPGVVTSVALAASGKDVFCGTWQDSAVRRYSLTGRERASLDAESHELQYVQSLADSDRILVTSRANRSGGDGEAVLMESNGYELSRYALDASQSMRAIASPDGLFVCIGCNRAILHNGKPMPERHAILYDCNGRKLWDKGSVLLQMTPVLVARGGFVVAGDSRNTLYVVNPAGEIKKACKLPAAMLGSVASGSGCRALVRCVDGRFYCIAVER